MEFAWSDVVSCDASDDSLTFSFEYRRAVKQKVRVVKISTPYYLFLYDCFEQIKKERALEPASSNNNVS